MKVLPSATFDAEHEPQKDHRNYSSSVKKNAKCGEKIEVLQTRDKQTENGLLGSRGQLVVFSFLAELLRDLIEWLLDRLIGRLFGGLIG